MRQKRWDVSAIHDVHLILYSTILLFKPKLCISEELKHPRLCDNPMTRRSTLCGDTPMIKQPPPEALLQKAPHPNHSPSERAD